jgi:hypothetical protein
MININFTYRHCTKEDLANEVSFDEAIFTSKLNELEALNNEINHIDVIFELDAGQASDKFKTTVNVVSPKLGHTHLEKGDDYAKVARTAIDRTIQDLHKKNQQLTDHK